MDELDSVLMKLGSLPVPAALDALEEGIFVRLSNKPVLQIRTGARAATVAIAVAIGIAGGTLPQRVETGSLTPLASVSPLSPAALLLGGDR